MHSQEHMSEARSLDGKAEEEEFSTGADAGDVDEEPSTDEISFFTRRRIAQTLVIVLLLIVAIYLLFPKLIGLESALGKLSEGDPKWIAVAIGFNVFAYLGFVTLFKGVVGGDVLPLKWVESYEITMAGLAAALLFSAGGAGGVALNYWALRRAGMGARRAACRMVAFLVLLYAVYISAVIGFGVLLRTGVLHGDAPVELTVIPAAVAGIVVALGLLITLVPGDLQRRLEDIRSVGRMGRLAHRLAPVPETAARGVRTAIEIVRHPGQGWIAIAGAIGYWAANVGILWASFKAYGIEVPLGVVVQGFFIGLAANLFPFAPAGVGAVDAGMIGAFVLFGLPGDEVFAAVLTYRLNAFWLPIPFGVVAFFQLRHTVQRWNVEGKPIDRVPAPSLARS
jgi:uncharacterized membrane protein YbhN (UPF0104 family)